MGDDGGDDIGELIIDIGAVGDGRGLRLIWPGARATARKPVHAVLAWPAPEPAAGTIRGVASAGFDVKPGPKH